MLNQWVLHRLYGLGQIIAVQGDLVTVGFAGSEKVFFTSEVIAQKGLKFLDQNVAAQVLAQTPVTQSAPAAFTVDETYSNADINAQFDGQTTGRIRRGDQALVLIAEVDDTVDEAGHFLFSGVGASGNQSLTKAPNKTLAKAGDQCLHVFAPAPHRAYTYLGQAQLIAEPVAVVQPDRHGDDRQVWQFPLQFN